MRIKRGLHLAVCGSHAALVLALMIDIGSVDWSSAIFAIVIYLWAVAPVVALAMIHRPGVTTAIGAALIGTWGVYLYWRAFYGPDIDPQSGLVFIFIPFYQLVGAAICVVFAVAITAAITAWTRKAEADD